MNHEILWEFEEARGSGETLDTYFSALPKQHMTGDLYAKLALVDFEHQRRDLRRIRSYLDKLRSIEQLQSIIYTFLQAAYASIVLGPPPYPSLNELREQSAIQDWPPPKTEADLIALDEIIAGRYRVIRRLGKGAFSITYLIEGVTSKDLFVLKTPPANDDTALRPTVDDLYRNEAEIYSCLDHPGIPRFIERLAVRGRPVLIIEYIHGTSLRQILRDGPIPERRAAYIVQQVADALHHCHTRLITHRDVNPTNILLGVADRANLIDFGLALRKHDQSTKEGEIAGTPSYMAPNAFLGRSHLIDGRDDVWSLAMTLYECVTGSIPRAINWIHEYSQAQLMTIRIDLVTNLSPQLRSICKRCLIDNAQSRFQTAHRVAIALRQYLNAPSVAPSIDEARSRLWNLFSVGLRIGNFERHRHDFTNTVELTRSGECDLTECIQQAIKHASFAYNAYVDTWLFLYELGILPEDLPCPTIVRPHNLCDQHSGPTISALTATTEDMESIASRMMVLMEIVIRVVAHSDNERDLIILPYSLAWNCRKRTRPSDLEPLAKSTIIPQRIWGRLRCHFWPTRDRQTASDRISEFERNVREFLLHEYVP